jgi:hypothetical protein
MKILTYITKPGINVFYTFFNHKPKILNKNINHHIFPTHVPNVQKVIINNPTDEIKQNVILIKDMFNNNNYTNKYE